MVTEHLHGGSVQGTSENDVEFRGGGSKGLISELYEKIEAFMSSNFQTPTFFIAPSGPLTVP